MTPMRACFLLLIACGSPTVSTLGNQTNARSEAPDLGIVLAPRKGDVKTLAKYITKTQRSGDGLDGSDILDTTWDFDGDKVDDLAAVGVVMYGPSQGWNVSIRDGTKMTEAFAISGDWADAREQGGLVAMRFEANTLAPGEPRFSVLVRYDRADKKFLPQVRAYVASQTKVPAVGGPFATFTTLGPATLRAAPAIDDAPIDPDNYSDDWNRSATLRGNVVATYAANARGLVLASDGDWRYVAFDFAIRPEQTSLAHGMDTGAGSEDQKLTSDTWLCGWIKASEIR